jgi:hypothetical protein
MNTSDEELTTSEEELKDETLREDDLPEDDEDSEDEVDTEEEIEPEEKSRHPIPFIYVGGNTDREPTDGWRRSLYDLHPLGFPGINVGPTSEQIVQADRQACIEHREQLRVVPGAVCTGNFSNRGGDGKSMESTMQLQQFWNMNPGTERAILIDINTSMTTLDVINGLDKKDFLTGRYWTMETLYGFIVQQGGDIEDFNDLNAKLAYRNNPQLPIIPLQLKPATRGTGKSKKSKFTGEQYLTVLRVLKKFFTLIIHDFGTDDDSELTRTAFSQLHMLAVLTHTGIATTQMVGYTLEMLFLDFKELLENSTVIFNLSLQPSRQALRAIALEKAGRKSRLQQIAERLSPRERERLEIQTPGQALVAINDIIEVEELLDPLELHEIVLVGHDSHLKRESRHHLDQVSKPVQAQLWSATRRMLEARVEFEARLLAQLPDELPDGVLVRRMDRMAIEIPADMPEGHGFLRNVPEGFVVVRRKPKEQFFPTASASTVSETPEQ